VRSLVIVYVSTYIALPMLVSSSICVYLHIHLRLRLRLNHHPQRLHGERAVL
jgi:hypothetical protein